MKFEIGSTLLSVDNLSAFRRVLFYLLVPIFFFLILHLVFTLSIFCCMVSTLLRRDFNH